MPTDGVVDEDWLEELAGQRWRGMHPTLIPFARDGWGNRFCFVRPGAAQGALRPGDALPDVRLFPLSDAPPPSAAAAAATSLRAACAGPQPTLLVAGSWT